MLDFSNTHHAHEQQLGGARAPRRSPRLRVLASKGPLPKTRADCPIERPCPHVQCPHHLQAIDTRPNQHSTGERRFPKYVDARRPSCELDYIERRGMTVAEVAEVLAITERHAYRLLRSGLAKLRRLRRMLGEDDDAT